MNQDVSSPRHGESPLTRRTRDASPPTANCLEVQWRFLQHKNPTPPQFGSSHRTPLLVDVHRSGIATHSEANSPSRLFQLFATQDLEADEADPSHTRQQERNLPESPRASRALHDLMGETQRQAMLDRILADMEYLAVEPSYSRLGQPEDKAAAPRTPQRTSRKPSILQTALQKEATTGRPRKFSTLWSLSRVGSPDTLDDDDDEDESEGNGQTEGRKRRHRRNLQQPNQEDDGPRIFWQKTSGAVPAADVPERLLTLSPSPPRRLQSSSNIVLGRRCYTPRQLPSTTTDSHQRGKPLKPVTATALPAHPPRRQRLPVAAPVSPCKAQYGAWYVPQTQWWSLHLEQQDKLPVSAPPPTAAASCHGAGASPAQRQHKPPLPRVNESSPSSSCKPQSGRSQAARAPAATPPSTPGPLELQVAAIPQSYIGREYRAYIVSTGTNVPEYLQ